MKRLIGERLKTSKELYKFVEDTCNIYSDVDMPINSCIEQFLKDNCYYSDDDCFELAMHLSERYYKECC